MRLKLQTDRAHKIRAQSKTRHFSLIEMEGGRGGGLLLIPYYMKFWRHFNLANLATF